MTAVFTKLGSWRTGCSAFGAFDGKRLTTRFTKLGFFTIFMIAFAALHVDPHLK